MEKALTCGLKTKDWFWHKASSDHICKVKISHFLHERKQHLYFTTTEAECCQVDLPETSSHHHVLSRTNMFKVSFQVLLSV
jgi:hypothetical protein